jgi:hypothetical protein
MVRLVGEVWQRSGCGLAQLLGHRDPDDDQYEQDQQLLHRAP